MGNEQVELQGRIGQIRQAIEQRLKEAELDGFLAAYFLSRYMAEDRLGSLASKLKEFGENYVFTRTNVAMLGIALERTWLVATADLGALFVEGYERLERQQRGAGLTYRESLRLLWGVAVGAQTLIVASTRPEIGQRVGQALGAYADQMRDRPRDRVLATAILSDLDPPRRQDRGRDLSYYLLGLKAEELSDSDALAVLWALRRRCFMGDQDLESGTKGARLALYDQLLPRLWHLGTIEDILDALLGYDLHAAVLRELAAGIPYAADVLSLVRRSIEYFPETARRLRDRKHNRPPLLVENEYDVQDLLYVMLKPHIPDLTDEEWTSQDAIRSKRIDFVSNAGRFCLEAKKTRDVDHAKGIADELKVDIESYYIHKACDTLVIFIYDPDSYLIDPRQQETQLSGLRTIKGRTLDVLVYIRPR